MSHEFPLEQPALKLIQFLDQHATATKQPEPVETTTNRENSQLNAMVNFGPWIGSGRDGEPYDVRLHPAVEYSLSPSPVVRSGGH